MAVTYLNRLLVLGAPDRVLEFRDTMRRTLDRQVGERSWQEDVPFSLETVARLTRTRDPDSYCEPYGMSVWPIRRVTPRRAELRYQFETRNLEMSDLVTALSKRFPKLMLRLVIHCLDDDRPYGFEMRAGRTRTRSISNPRHEAHWNAARRKFRLRDDDVYDDDVATEFAEERMREAVLNALERTPELRRRRDWWNQVSIRSIEDEQVFALAAINDAIDKKDAARRARRRKAARKKR